MRRRRRSGRCPTHAPHATAYVIGDQQRAIAGDGHADRSAIGIAAGVEETGQDVLGRPGRPATRDRDELIR
jgi:hypothetical protein